MRRVAPLQRAWPAVAGVQRPPLAAIPLPVPPGTRQRGVLRAWLQSGRLKMPCGDKG